MEKIREFGRQIGVEFQPQQVILFGSYARDEASPDSDVDLLVVTDFEGRPADKSVEIRMKLRPKFPLDLIVRTPARVRERLELGDDFMREIFAQGKVLYEADND